MARFVRGWFSLIPDPEQFKESKGYKGCNSEKKKPLARNVDALKVSHFCRSTLFCGGYFVGGLNSAAPLNLAALLNLAAPLNLAALLYLAALLNSAAPRTRIRRSESMSSPSRRNCPRS